ncbi:WxL protein host-binding domain-containing protein, partial [Streptomyces althioticus]
IKNDDKQTGTIETNYEIEKILPVEFTIGKPTAIDNKSLAKSFVKAVRQEDGNLKIDVENDNAALVDGGKIDITVLKDASKVFSFETNIQLAPKSKTTLEIPWNGDLSSGDYKASVETTFNKNSSKKSFNFSIANKEVEQVKKQTFEDEKNVVESNSNGLLIGCLIGALIVLVVLVLVIMKQRKFMKNHNG